MIDMIDKPYILESYNTAEKKWGRFARINFSSKDEAIVSAMNWQTINQSKGMRFRVVDVRDGSVIWGCK